MIRLEAQEKNAHRAIGRYVVQFSRLIWHMRKAMTARLSGPGGRDLELATLAFSGATASPIADAFFGMCRMLAEMDKDEQAIEKRLRMAVNNEIKRRNDIAHGDWLIAGAISDDMDVPDPTLVRIKAARIAGPLDLQEHSIEDLDKVSYEVEQLWSVVWEFGAICTSTGAYHPAVGRKPERIRDVLVIEDGHVVRRPGNHGPHSYDP